MENLNINYDILEKIQEAKGKWKLKRNLKRGFKFAIPYTMGSSIGCIINYLITNNIPEVMIYRNAIINTLIMISPFLISTIMNKIHHTSDEIIAYSNLKTLSSRIKSLNIKTTAPLLINSFLYDKKYKLNFQKKHFPSLTENKQIIIPIEDDNGNVQEIIASQQHKVGSNQYKLSFNQKRK